MLENYKYYGKTFKKERAKTTSSNKSKQTSSKKKNPTKNELILRKEKEIIKESLYTEPTNKIVENDLSIENKTEIARENVEQPQKELTQSERNAKFEHEIASAFDKFINDFGKYYNYPELKARTFTYNLSCYLNNTMYKSEYISGDFENRHESVNLGSDFDLFIMRLPIHFRDDYNTNYDTQYKIQLTHTPKGTTVNF